MNDPVAVGAKAPAFNLKDQDGHAHRLSAYTGRWVVLYFYPKDNTPGCTKQACAFRDWVAARNSGDAPTPSTPADAVVFGVSPDDAAAHTRFTQKHGLNFPLLVDPEQKVAQKYGVWREKSMYGKTFMGVVRTTYLINPKGKVAARWDKVRVPGHVEAVLAALEEAAG